MPALRLLPLAALAVSLAGASAQQPTARTPARTIELRPGLVITSSARVAPKVYRLAAPAALDSAVIVVRGSDITVDFAGAELVGADPDAPRTARPASPSASRAGGT